MKKKLIIVQNFFSKQRLYLFNQLAKKIDLTVVYLQPPKSEHRKWSPEEENIQYKYIQLNFKKKLPTGLVWGDTKKLREFVDTINNTDTIVLLLNHPTNLIVLKILNLLKRKKHKNTFLWVADTLKANWVDSLIHKIVKQFFDSYLIRRVKNFFLYSKGSQEYVHSYTTDINKAIIVPQATLPRELLPTEPLPKTKGKQITFGFLGYLVFHKNIYFLLKSFCNAKIPGKLVIAGDGPERHHINYFVKQCPQKFEYLGYLKDTPENKQKFFQRIDYLILPSAKEVWGLVVNEAMYFGIPTIVSKNVGASELVEQVDKNLIFDIKHTKEYIKLHGMIDSKEIYKTLSPKTQVDFYRVLTYAYTLWKNNPTIYQTLRRKAYTIATQKYTVENAVNNILKVI